MIYAMKVLYKNKVMSIFLIIYKIENNLTKYAITERNVLSLTSHPFIVKMNYAF